MIFIAAQGKNLSKRYFANVVDYVALISLLAIYIFVFGQQESDGDYHVRGFKALVIPVI